MVEYFAPKAKKRWCFSLYNNAGNHAFGAFPQAAMVSYTAFYHIQCIVIPTLLFFSCLHMYACKNQNSYVMNPTLLPFFCLLFVLVD